MNDQNNIVVFEDWRRRVLIAGAAIGVLVGVGAAYLFIQRAEDPENRPSFSTGDGLKLGLIVLGLLRQVADLGD